MFYFIAFGLNCQCYQGDIRGSRIFIGEVNPVCSERDKSSLNNAYLGNAGGVHARAACRDILEASAAFATYVVHAYSDCDL